MTESGTCPHCGWDGVTPENELIVTHYYGEAEFSLHDGDDGVATVSQEVTCGKCEESWYEVYTFARVIKLRGGDSTPSDAATATGMYDHD